MYRGEAAIHLNCVNMFLQNAKDLQIKQLTDCFVTGNTFENEHANSEEVAQYDDIDNSTNLDIHANHEDISEPRKGPKSKSSNIDEILSLDLTAYRPDMDEPDSGNQLHKCGECGAGYKWKNALVKHIKSKHEGVKYSCNQCGYQATRQDHLKKHKEAIHEGVKYSCNQTRFHQHRGLAQSTST